MKKILFTALVALVAMGMQAQNFQLHYDFGRMLYSDEEDTRQVVTLTYEQYKADKLGSWYWFADFDMHHDGMKGAYAEISREFTLCKSGLAAHVEYDGGLTSSKDDNFATRFQNAALIGPALNLHNSDYSQTLSFQLMYKQYFKGSGHRSYASAQFTAVWGIQFAKGKGTFSGFIDLWRGEKNVNNHGQLVILAEPQLWYNPTKHLSIGTEIEFSQNFIYNEKPGSGKNVFINPTLAVKYSL